MYTASLGAVLTASALAHCRLHPRESTTGRHFQLEFLFVKPKSYMEIKLLLRSTLTS